MRVIASVLNVRSGPGTNFRVVGQVRKGDIVSPKEVHGDWSWIMPPGGWASSAFLESFRLRPPIGLTEIIRTFGQPGAAAASSGRTRFPEKVKLGWSDAEVTQAACHAEMVPIFDAVWAELYAAGHWDKIKTFDGIYNNRPTTGGTKKSTHAWGISADLNAATNRYGTKGDMPKEIIEIFEKHGFLHLKRDPMHFQYARAY